jgi:hypothetical protein
MANLTIEQMLEELNDSDVTCEAKDLASTLLCLDGAENVADFRVNVSNAIDEAEALLKSLRALKATTC